jgi:uncharacterized membrane protein YhaH (DUF805 family)
MDFKEAVESGFKNWKDFHGRAARSEYWWWWLFTVLVYLAANILDEAATGGLLSAVAYLALLVPSLSLAFRRLHDLDRTAWWLLIGFIPILGGLVLLFWMVQKGTDGKNRCPFIRHRKTRLRYNAAS